MHLAWWVWISFGIIVLLTEAVTPGGFYLLFIGFAAVLTGIASVYIGELWVEGLLFALLSVALITFLRKPLVERLRKDTPAADVPEFIGETAKAIETIAAGGEGTIELRGSTWKALNESDRDCVKDASCTVTARKGLTMVITPK